MSVTNYRLYCNTESEWVNGWGVTAPNTCYNNNTHDVNLNSIQELGIVTDTFDVANGKIKVAASEETLFGEIKMAQYTPIIQNYIMYGLISDQYYRHYSNISDGIVSSSNGIEMELNIPDTLYSYSVVRSTQVLKHRPGYANTARFNTVFDVGVTNCLQFAGVGNNGSDLYFCQNGPQFGVRLSTGGLSHSVELNISEACNENTIVDIVLNGVTYNIPLSNSNNDIYFTISEIAYGVTYPGWTVENNGLNIIFHAQNVGQKNGIYSFNSSIISGTFNTLKTGRALSTTFIPQHLWNGTSPMIAELNPQKRNMYSIEYSWHDAGNVRFKIYNPDKSIYETVHLMSFANNQTDPTISSPNMFLQWGVASLGSTVARKMKISGCFGATEGKIDLKYPTRGIFTNKSISANTETVLSAFKNTIQYNGFSNQSEILIQRLTISNSGNKPVKIKVYRNPSSLSNNNALDYINWNRITSDSLCLVDTTSKTFEGGNLIDIFQIAANGNMFMDLKQREYYIHQKDILIFTAESRAISEIDMSFTILEDL